MANELKGKPEILQIVENLQNTCGDMVSKVTSASNKMDTLKKNFDSNKSISQKNSENISGIKNDISNIQTKNQQMNSSLKDATNNIASILQTISSLGKSSSEGAGDIKIVAGNNGADNELILPFKNKSITLKTNISKFNKITNASGKRIQFTTQFPNNCFFAIGVGTYFKEKNTTYYRLGDITVFDRSSVGFAYNGTANIDSSWYGMIWLAIGY